MPPKENEEVSDLLQVDFEFLDPKPQHFHSLKNLLSLLFRDAKSAFCLSKLADHIISQASRFGIVWEQVEERESASMEEEEREIFGLCTFVTLDGECPVDFKRFIQAKEPKAQEGDAVFISTRPCNIPVEICKSAFSFVLDDLTLGSQEEGIKRIFTVCPMAVDEEEEVEVEEEKKIVVSEKKKKKKMPKIQLHLFPENEILENFACSEGGVGVGGGKKSIVKLSCTSNAEGRITKLIGMERGDFVSYCKSVIDYL